ncbi:Lrp/AsnC family transcriptional regulator [Thaumasiovibrio subtropicus]|uniref:Lrp/AsnC family transcriptional regulator n=1 Tax=Thaumasiovibrio subtropicus TaxID=1891207 RepID=UPI000B3552C1|nr:Lrp/AsnC family transcriptional regulator [Thaumasiovibrio subtropicus]
MSLDSIDRRILTLLQEDATLSLAVISEQVNLSQSPCWKRIKRLEEAGVIRSKVALLDAEKLGVAFTAYVQITTSDHSEEWYLNFCRTVSEFKEVMEFYRMAGEYDYLLKVQVSDMKDFDRFYKRLVNSVCGLNNVTSTFAMEAIKYTTAISV